MQLSIDICGSIPLIGSKTLLGPEIKRRRGSSKHAKGDANMEAVGRHVVGGLISEVGRVEPELVFVCAADGEPAADAVVDAGSGRDGEIVAIANQKWVLDFTEASEALGVGLEFAEAVDNIARTCEIVVLGFAVEAVEAHEAGFALDADVRRHVVVGEGANSPEPLIAFVREAGVDVRIFRASPQRAAWPGGRRNNLTTS